MSFEISLPRNFDFSNTSNIMSVFHERKTLYEKQDFALLLLEKKQYDALLRLPVDFPNNSYPFADFLFLHATYVRDFFFCAKLLELFFKMMSRERTLKVINILRHIYFKDFRKTDDMLYFQKLCFVLHSFFGMSEKWVGFLAKQYEKKLLSSQIKLYFWWIAICYNPQRESGKRMAEQSWLRVCNYFLKI